MRKPGEMNLQQRAQLENYAIFQLRSMRSNLHHVFKVCESAARYDKILVINNAIAEVIVDIKREQNFRKQAREQEKERNRNSK